MSKMLNKVVEWFTQNSAPQTFPKKEKVEEQKDKKPAPKKKVGRPKTNKICSVVGCNRKHQAKGYCQKHYQKYHKSKLRRKEKRVLIASKSVDELLI